MTPPGSMPGYGGGSGSDQGISGQNALPEGRERGARRRKIAGYLQAANELRQSYQQSYGSTWGSRNADDGQDDAGGIPGAFPAAAVVRHGDEEMILFPSYCKRHVKKPAEQENLRDQQGNVRPDGAIDEDYWKRQWERHEDDKAIVDVDVRGWIYSPHRGPMSRKNRVLIGLARQLSGIPAPKSEDKNTSRSNSPGPQSLRARHEAHEARKEQEKIAQEAEQILTKGKGEEEVALHGGYSEQPKDDSDADSVYSSRGRRRGSLEPSDAPGPGQLTKRSSWSQPADMTHAELMQANAHLMARLRPFLTTPLVAAPITIFFYDEKTSQSRTIMTNEAGHFSIRAALDFIPTHVRVLASENLSATEKVVITEPKGVSLISDVDDTIKHSSIGSGAREIFRNAFIRDLDDLTIDGVKEWYNTMYDMKVGIHYVSNSPWQLLPVLLTFFKLAGLPPGSYHLKQYSGMLQGIFEPVAERKKGTLEKILRDFPERKFLLIGDSGEADLEVYTDVVLANPHRILGVFIRDVTTSEATGFFDSSMGPLRGDRYGTKGGPSRGNSGDSRSSKLATFKDSPHQRPPLPARIATEATPQQSAGPAVGKLIDFDDEPQEMDVHESHRRIMPRSASDFQIDSVRRHSAPDQERSSQPPLRPAKPLALRGAATDNQMAQPQSRKELPVRPPKPRRLSGHNGSAQSSTSPLSQTQNTSEIRSQNQGYVSSARQKLSSAYNSIPSASSYGPSFTSTKASTQVESRQNSSTSTKSDKPPPVPPRRGVAASASTYASSYLPFSSSRSNSATRSPENTDDESAYSPTTTPANKKVELWQRRLKRARGILESQGVMLRTWKVGEDVCLEAVQLIEKSMKEMGVEGYGSKKGSKRNLER